MRQMIDDRTRRHHRLRDSNLQNAVPPANWLAACMTYYPLSPLIANDQPFLVQLQHYNGLGLVSALSTLLLNSHNLLRACATRPRPLLATSGLVRVATLRQ